MSKRIDSNQLLKENESREEKLFRPYNSLTGAGSPIDRETLVYDGIEWLIPKRTYKEQIITELSRLKSVRAVASQYELTEDQVSDAIFTARCKHDFEFWAVSCVKVQDKESKQMIPFRLRAAQRKLLARLEKMRLVEAPIRVILLKARQWGGSTLVQIYMAWIQLFHRTNWHSAIVADVENQARNIRNMYTKMAREYPSQIGTVTFRPFEGSTNVREIVERGNILGIGSAKNPNSLRSYDYAMLHLSEVGIWKDTPMQSPDDLVQALRGTVGFHPYTMIVMESTAKGVGNLFHREWKAAKRGDSGYEPVFVAWWEIEIYREPVKEMSRFLEGWTDEYQYLWDIGATLEGINWYVNHRSRERFDEWRMKEEFPSTPEEAFQTTGRRYFTEPYIRNANKDIREPTHVGDLIGKTIQGPDSLKDIKFESNPQGNLKVWLHPYEITADLPISKRYAVFVDIGGTNRNSDWSVIKVADRWPMLEGGYAECAAEWRGHIDPELLAWKSAQIAKWFDNAFLAVEVNALYSRGNNTDGVHYLTIFNEIADHYNNLFTRENPSKVKNRPTQYGYHMTHASKDILLSGLKSAWREGGGGWIEHSEVTVQEAAYFEIKEDGTMGAVQGEHDDSLIATAGVKWLATDHMPAPVYIHPMKKRDTSNYNESMF